MTTYRPLGTTGLLSAPWRCAMNSNDDTRAPPGQLPSSMITKGLASDKTKGLQSRRETNTTKTRIRPIHRRSFVTDSYSVPIGKK
jgi:hypothetical protein